MVTQHCLEDEFFTSTDYSVESLEANAWAAHTVVSSRAQGGINETTLARSSLVCTSGPSAACGGHIDGTGDLNPLNLPHAEDARSIEF